MNIGTLYQIVARFVFVLSSYGLHIILAYLIYDMTDYGRVGVVFSMLAMARVFLTTGVPQAISRFVAQDPNVSEGIFWTGLKFQLIVSVFITLIYVAGAWTWIVMVEDFEMLPLVLISALIIPTSGVYQTFQGYLAGKRAFALQAKILIFYSCARILLVLLLIIFGLGIAGVFWGITIAVVLGIFVSIKTIKLPDRTSSFDGRKILNFSVPIVFCSLGMTGMLNVDLLVLKTFYADAPVVGYYAGAVNVGKLPYFILIAFSTVLLPTITNALKHGEKKQAIELARSELSFLWSFIILGIAIVAGAAPFLLDFIYPSEFTAASTSLKILFIGSCCMAVNQSLVAVLGALNRLNLAVYILLAAIVVQLLLGRNLAPQMAGTGVAIANAIASLGVMVALTGLITRYWEFPFNKRDCGFVLLASPLPYWVMLYQKSMPLIFLPVMVVLASTVYFSFLLLVSSGFRKKAWFLYNGFTRRRDCSTAEKLRNSSNETD